MADQPVYVPREHPRNPQSIYTHSIVSHHTGFGIVVVEWNQERAQFDPEDARRFAFNLLREADNAETDSFVYMMLKDKLKLDPHTIGAVITDFRIERAKREQLAGIRSVTSGDEIPEEDRR